MSEAIISQIDTFANAVLLGVICEIIYDTIRILRRIIKKNLVVTVIEDIIFWILSSILLFILLYNKNGGMVRLYAIVGMGFGMIGFEVTIGKVYVKYLSKLFSKIFQIIGSILGKIINTIEILLKKLMKPFKIQLDRLSKKRCKHKDGRKQKKRLRGKKKRQKEQVEKQS